LRIATWNIERLRHKNSLPLITENCEQVKADILVLTETDSRICLPYESSFSTKQPKGLHHYNPTETRVTIYTNYGLVRHYDTFDAQTAICAELKTDIGNLIVYGTVIGIYGNRHQNFMQDLRRQVSDIKRLAKGNNLCVIGDFNCSFGDNYYFTKDGKTMLEEVFAQNGITLLTRKQLECIDHIAISNAFVANRAIEVWEWNTDKKLSDHKGVGVELL
jgi:endonuclease/exonuclease/phosphatase family metal-dependent hydrolase